MNVQKKLINAYFWNVFGKWGVRTIGIGSTLILVRLIAPESFGIIALAGICIGFFETLQAIGIDRYLITKTSLSPEDMNSGWTLNIILKLTISLALVIASPYMSYYFDEPRLDLVITVVAVNGFFSSFNNIGLIKLKKNLEFKMISYLELVVKVISTVITVIFAYFSPNYWALIVGSGASVWIYLFGSYIICDYRPKFRFKFERSMFSFSIFIVFRNVLSYCRNRGDTFVVSKLFDVLSIGKYKVGLDFAIMPFSEIIMPAGQAMFPGMANYKNNKNELLDKSYKYLALVYLFLIPSVVGIWFIAPQFCTVILGEKWSDTAPIMSSLAILMIAYPISAMTNNLFDYLGMPKFGVFNDLFGLMSLLFIAISFTFDGVDQFSQFRGYIGLATFLFAIVFARITISFSIKKMLEIIIVPVAASFFMYIALSSVYFDNSMTLLGMLSNVLFGAMVYTCCLLFLIAIFKSYSDVWCFWYAKIIDASNGLRNFRKPS
ncbi:oligosaccharide flippase family protein [Vibrio alfacsensis]|uniref:oligosaccharide flippase family protein n=1 Tax=Vibrio TaxID=662 RepID=UPI004067B3B6